MVKFDEAKFLQLKKQLDALQYREPLGIESAILVQRLLNDLVKTTQSFQQLESQYHVQTKELTRWQHQVAPLQKENGRFLKENNKLHVDLIKQAEEADVRETKLRAQVKALEDKLEEVRFVNVQVSHKNRVLERELDQSKHRIEQLLQKNWLSTANKRGEVVNMASRQQTIQMEDFLAPAGMRVQHPEDSNPEALSVLRMAETKNDQLQATADDLLSQKLVLTDKIHELQHQVDSRGREIDRLNKLLQGGRTLSQVEHEKESASSDRRLAQLNSQVDFLNSQVAALEAERAQWENATQENHRLHTENNKLDRRVHQVEDQNRALLEELRDIKRMASRLGDEKTNITHARKEVLKERNKALAAAKKENEDLGVALKRLEKDNKKLASENVRISEVMENYHKEKRNFARLINESNAEKQSVEVQLHAIRVELEDARSEQARLEAQTKDAVRSADTAAADLDHFKDSISRLQNEKQEDAEMVLQLRQQIRGLERTVEQHAEDAAAMKRRNDTLQSELERTEGLLTALQADRQQMVSETEQLTAANDQVRAMVTAMESERHQWKTEHEEMASRLSKARGEVDALRQQVDTHAAEVELIRGKLKLAQDENISLNSGLDARLIEVRTLESELTRVKTEKTHLETVEPRVAELQQELHSTRLGSNELEMEVARLKRDLKGAELRTRDQGDSMGDLNAKLSESERERHYLSQQLVNFEEQLASIQDAVRTVSADRDHVKRLYDQAKDELRNRLETNRHQAAERDQASLAVKRLEAEKDSLRRQLDHTSSQLNVAREELASWQSSATEAEHKEQSAFSAQMRAVDSARLLEKERDALQSELSAVQEDLREAQVKAREANSQAMQLRHTVNDKDAEVTQLNSLLRQLDGSQDALSDRIKSLSGDLEASRRRATESEAERTRLEVESTAAKNEVTQVREVLASLDRERDEIQEQLDTKTEELVALQSSHADLQEAIRSLQTQYEGLKRHSEAQTAQLDARERDVAVQQQQLQRLEQASMQLTTQVQGKDSELHTVADDLATMTRENQVVNQEWAKVSAERERLAARLAEATARIVYLEQVQTEAASEKHDLLSSYRALNDTKSRLEQEAVLADKQLLEARVQLQSRDQEIDAQRTHILQVEEENKRYVLDLRAYERQSEELSRALSTKDHVITDLKSSSERLQNDVNSTQVITRNLEQIRHETQAEVAFLQAENEQLNGMYREQRSHAESCQEQLGAEKKRCAELESLVASLRSSEYVTEVRHQAADGEVKQLKERVRVLTDTNEQYAKQVRDLVERQAQSQEEVSALRRDLTASRVERESVLHDESMVHARVDDLEQTIAQQKKVISELDHERGQLKTYAVKYEQELSKLERQVLDLASDLHLSEEQKSELTQRVADLSASERRLSGLVEAADQARRMIVEQAADARDASAARDRTVYTLEGEMGRMHSDLADARARADASDQDAVASRQRYNDLKAENARLQALLSKMDDERDAVVSEYSRLLESERSLRVAEVSGSIHASPQRGSPSRRSGGSTHSSPSRR